MARPGFFMLKARCPAHPRSFSAFLEVLALRLGSHQASALWMSRPGQGEEVSDESADAGWVVQG